MPPSSVPFFVYVILFLFGLSKKKLLVNAYKNSMLHLIISSAFIFLFHIFLLVLTKGSAAMAPRSSDNIYEINPEGIMDHKRR